jgi:hypothetical protein
MPHILTSFLAFHWALAFALLAVVCVMGGDGGAVAALDLLGVSLSHSNLEGGVAPKLLSLAFTIGSVLFAWAFLTAFFSDEAVEGNDDVMRMAFGSAGGVLSLVLICGTAQGAAGVFPVVAAHLAALLASYLAIRAENWSVSISGVPGEADIRAAARIMALGAAHGSMLARLSGRPDADIGGRL